VILLLGTLDDRRKLRPATKLLIETLSRPDSSSARSASRSSGRGSFAADLAGGAVTVLWIVGVTNAFIFSTTWTD